MPIYLGQDREMVMLYSGIVCYREANLETGDRALHTYENVVFLDTTLAEALKEKELLKRVYKLLTKRTRSGANAPLIQHIIEG